MLNPISPLKIIAHREKILQAIRGEMPSPVTMGLDITNYCNNDCIWCIYKDYRKEHLAQMSNDMIESIISNIGIKNNISICSSGGGEPTVNENFEYMISLCKAYNVPVSLNTNGCRLDKISDETIKYLTYIRVSLDAGTPESYEKLHQPKEGSFNSIIENIERCAKLTKVGVGYLVHPDNYQHIYDFGKKLDNINCKYLQLRPLKNVTLSYDQTAEVYSALSALISYCDMEIYESFSKMEDTIAEKITFKKCYMNKLVANIGPDGNVYTCCELRGINPIGNVRDMSFNNIWQSDKHKEMVKTLDITKCPPCKYAKMNEIIERVFINGEMDLGFI